MAQGVKFNYLYRDGSNYKNYGEVIFTNLTSIELDLIREIIVSNLIDGEFFVAKEWGLPELFFDSSNEDDHGWHEFHSIEVTKDNSDVGSIEELLNRITLPSK